ncbi:hypothetical protein V8F20_010740 [Naviculisporaceae sp. PSN 640]
MASGSSGASGGDWAGPKTSEPKSTSTYDWNYSASSYPAYTPPARPVPEPLLNSQELEYWSHAQVLADRVNQGRDIIYNRFVAGLEYATVRLASRPHTGQLSLGTGAQVTSIDLSTGLCTDHRDFPSLRQQAKPSGRLKPSFILPPSLGTRMPGTAPFFVVEDYNKEVVCILGQKMEIPIGFFADHYTTDEGTVHMDAIRSFPTTEQLENSNSSRDTRVIIRYPVIAPKDAITAHPRVVGHARTGQSTYAWWVVERQMETPDQQDVWDHDGLVVTASSQLSYWVMGKGKAGEGSTVLLVDPPISMSGVSDPSSRNLVRLAEFEDPKPAPNTTTAAIPAPGQRLYTNTSLYNDIQTFISQTTLDEELDLGAETLAFARRFAQNNWIALINHARGCLNKLRSKLYSPGIRVEKNGASSYSPHFAGGPFAEWVLERLADWSAALALYALDVEANMLALGIDLEIPDSNGSVSKQEAQRWRYIYKTLGVYRDLYRQTADSYMQVTALREAQAVGKLTRLGLLFLPAGFVAGLLSMGGEFLPGQSMFWVFWVVALPVVLLVLGLFSWEGGGGFGGTGDRVHDDFVRYWRRAVAAL